MNIVSKLIAIFVFSLAQTVTAQKVTAYLINCRTIIPPDTTKIFRLDKVPDSIIDLNFCIKYFHYPPAFPLDIKLHNPIMSDSSAKVDWTKYLYDKSGRLSQYFYQGSLVSGIEPLSYKLTYINETSINITKILDDKDNSNYYFYYLTQNIAYIDLKDKENKIIERLLIKQN